MSVPQLLGVFTITEAAELAKVGKTTLRKEIASGHLRAKRIGKCVRILEEDLVAWLRHDFVTSEMGSPTKEAS